MKVWIVEFLYKGIWLPTQTSKRTLFKSRAVAEKYIATRNDQESYRAACYVREESK